MPLYLCRAWDGEPQPVEVARVRFVAPHELSSYPMPEADLPLINWISTVLTG